MSVEDTCSDDTSLKSEEVVIWSKEDCAIIEEFSDKDDGPKVDGNSGKDDCSDKDKYTKVEVIPGWDDDSKSNELLRSVVVVEPEARLLTGGMPVEVPSPKLEDSTLETDALVVLWVFEGSKLKSEVMEKLFMNPEDWLAENDAKLDSYEEIVADIELWMIDEEGMVDAEKISEVNDVLWDSCPEEVCKLWDRKVDSDWENDSGVDDG